MVVGNIGPALIDTLLVSDPAVIIEGDLKHVLNEWFVVAYTETTATEINVASFSVANDGTIPAAVQDSFTITGVRTGTRPRMQKVADGIFAIFYNSTSGASGDVTLETFSVDASGNLSTAIDTLVISATSPQPDGIFECTAHDGIFVLVFISSGISRMRTIDIDSSGNIGAATIDSVNLGTFPTSAWPSIVWTGQGDYHAVVQVAVGQGNVETWTIDSSGNIAAAETDTFQYENSNAGRPSMGSNDNGILFILYEGPGSVGDVTTVLVDGSGMLSAGDDIGAMAISGEHTRLLRIDEQGDKNVFLGVANGSFETWSFDGSGNISDIDNLGAIAEIENFYALDFLPGSSSIVVGCGNKVSATEFYVFSLDVEANIDETGQPVAISAQVGMIQREVLLL